MKNYSPKSFFRKIPGDFLQKYFHSINLFLDFNFSEIPQRKAVDVLAENLENISKSEYDKIDKDFRNIFALGNEGGIRAILEEAQHSKTAVAKDFESLEDFLIKSFWCFLKFPALFREALTVSRYYYDSRYWRKIVGLPTLELQVSLETTNNLSQKISTYFFKQEGRGRACQIEHYDRGDLQFFFAFPEDYARTDMEWEGNALASKSRKPAFEIIFVYSQSQGSLEVYFEGPKKVVTKLEEMFAQAILAIEKLPSTIQDRIYELNRLKTPNFTFSYGTHSGIKEVKIKELRFALLPQARNLTLTAKSDDPPDAIYSLIEQFFVRGYSSADRFPLGMAKVTQATISVLMSDSSCKKGEVKKTIKITWPDGCNLRNEDKDPILRKMLVDSELEVTYGESERQSKAG